jgi:ribose 5-phosphate isomerase B
MDYISESDIRNIVQKVIQTLPATVGQSSAESSPHPIPANAHSNNTVAIGSDHGGYEMKSMLLAYLSELGFQPIDCGTHSKESVDYPDFAYAVADKVRNGSAWRGIVIDGAGIGSCMAANKVPGVRAAMCYDYATALNSREHNDANLLTLGAGLLGENQVKLVVKTWLETPFGGARHARRVDKIMEIEKKFMREG